MLTIEAASVRFGPVTAVGGVDLTVPDGQVLVLLGPSGCGKSTLLRAVAGLEPLTGGRICWDGRELTGVPVHRRRFGLMFQDGVLFPHRTVAGNVGYGLAGGARWTGSTAAARHGRVAELLDLVGLSGYGGRRVDTLSGGQAQRVALARALAPEPRLLLLDEPLAALDRSLRERLLEDLRGVLRVTGTTALFVTHDQGEAFAVGDQVALMNEGRIRQVGTPEQVWATPVDEWSARFVGYTSVIPAPVWRSAAAGELSGLTQESLVAVRPAAFRVESAVGSPGASAGMLDGTCRAVWPGPDSIRVSVEVPGLGLVQAITGKLADIQLGQLLRLRFEPHGAAVIPTGRESLPTAVGG